MRFKRFILYSISIIVLIFIITGISLNDNTVSKEVIKKELTSDFYTRLYSNTYYNLISRIEDDGFLQESMTGQYDGMYCRTVGAMVPLLIETKEYYKAELLLKCVFKAMKENSMNRIPHVIGKKKIIYNGSQKDSLFIIGKTDQIDGQVHNIMAWAKLALERGRTPFEDSTWDLVSNLMDRSTEKPYMDSSSSSFIPDLIYNFNFEHSRPLPNNYDLLTQCFTGAALESMIKIAERRKDFSRQNRWIQRLNRLKEGVRKHLTRKTHGELIYLELLEKKGSRNIPFLGFSWVNFSPAAAEWEPLNHKVMINTVIEMRKRAIRKWNGLKWMPTESWPNGDFSRQIIGKGIGWEIDFSRKENEWKRIIEILNMLKVVEHNEQIYMENSYLSSGSDNLNLRINDRELKDLKYAAWKIVDPGNGEQAAWWCWAVARLRKELGLSAAPKKLLPSPEISIVKDNDSTAEIKIHQHKEFKIFYSTDGTDPSTNSNIYKENFYVEKPANVKAAAFNDDSALSNISILRVTNIYSGLEYSCFEKLEDKSFNWLNIEPSFTGYTNNFDLKKFSSLPNKYGISWKGYIKINVEGSYKFFIITSVPSRLYIDKNNITSDISTITNNGYLKSVYLKKGYHKINLVSESLANKNILELYYSRDDKPKEIVDSNMFLFKIPGDSIIPPPRISPFKPEYDIDEKLLATIESYHGSQIYYTLNGSIPTENSLKYEKPIEINSSVTLKAAAVKNGRISSAAVMRYDQTKKTKINLKYDPGPKYGAHGPYSLLDGNYGSVNPGDGSWLGFEGDDFDALVDLREIKEINEIKINFLNSPGSWIFLPSEVEYFISNDGKQFEKVFDIIPDKNEQHERFASKKEYNLNLKKEGRFIIIIGKNIKVCPKWHPGDGNKAWLFIDEVTIN